MTDHDHDHPHEPITNGDEPLAARVQALEEVLVEKGVVTREDVRQRIDWLVSRSPTDGARLVARAWVDAEFKERLLSDAREAALELDLDPGPSPVVVALENTETVHHVVVCTLCSCYPKALLGPPPDWYKSAPYRYVRWSTPRRAERVRSRARGRRRSPSRRLDGGHPIPRDSGSAVGYRGAHRAGARGDRDAGLDDRCRAAGGARRSGNARRARPRPGPDAQGDRRRRGARSSSRSRPASWPA